MCSFTGNGSTVTSISLVRLAGDYHSNPRTVVRSIGLIQRKLSGTMGTGAPLWPFAMEKQPPEAGTTAYLIPKTRTINGVSTVTCGAIA